MWRDIYEECLEAINKVATRCRILPEELIKRISRPASDKTAKDCLTIAEYELWPNLQTSRLKHARTCSRCKSVVNMIDERRR